MTRRLCEAFIVAVLFALAVSNPYAQAAYPGQNGKLVFVRSDANFNQSLWTVEPDGTSPTRIPGVGSRVRDPVWSPDGSRIAFIDGSRLSTISPDGSGVLPLTPNGLWEFATWRPDAGRLAVTGCILS